MAHPVPVTVASPARESFALGVGASGLNERNGSAATNRTLVSCYGWLKRVEHHCRGLPERELRERVVAARRRLLRPRGDYSWANQMELASYASAYLDDLATSGPNAGGSEPAGYHPAIRYIRARLRKYADANWPVLLVGERGTGKGHLLRAITRSSGQDPLVVALATLPDSLAESELFGHVKGAFTGADRARDGIILTAHRSGSPVFLDDMGECPPNIQAKLLTVLDDGLFRPVGSDRMVSIGLPSERRFRLYAASQPASLAKLRADLRDRLAMIMVAIPPLRERGMDILLLADRFLWRAGKDAQSPRRTLSSEARLVLLEHDWPGNVRELIGVMARADFEAEDRAVLDSAAVRASMRASPDISTRGGHAPPETDSQADRFPTISEMIDRHIRAALDRTGGNVSAAAELLGRHRSTVHEWLRRREKMEAGDAKGDGKC